MNRLPQFCSDDDEFQQAIQVVDEPGPVRSRTPFPLALPHRLFFPQHFEARYQYPLLVWLHSEDSSEYELDEVAASISMRNYIAVGLRGPQASLSGGRRFNWSLSAGCLAIAEESALQAVRMACDDLAVDPRRVFIGGYGVGGSVAQWIALRHPQYFAGAASVNGAAPNLPKLLVRWREAQRLPVLFCYGRDSRVCDADAVIDTIRLVHRSGLNYQLNQFNCGDELDGAMTSLMNHFMLQATVQNR